MSRKAPTEKRRQWLWFALLWAGGLAVAAVLAQGVRLLLELL